MMPNHNKTTCGERVRSPATDRSGRAVQFFGPRVANRRPVVRFNRGKEITMRLIPVVFVMGLGVQAAWACNGPRCVAREGESRVTGDSTRQSSGRGPRGRTPPGRTPTGTRRTRRSGKGLGRANSGIENRPRFGKRQITAGGVESLQPGPPYATRSSGTGPRTLSPTARRDRSCWGTIRLSWRSPGSSSP